MSSMTSRTDITIDIANAHLLSDAILELRRGITGSTGLKAESFSEGLRKLDELAAVMQAALRKKLG